MKVLVVGQGLAGTILAWQLRAQGIDFSLVDPNPTWSASKVAGGLVDPISGQRYFQAWKSNVVLPVARAFYPEIEALLDVRFFHPKPSIRYFSSEDDRSLWASKRHLPNVRAAFPSDPQDYFQAFIRAPHQGVEVVGSAYLDTVGFLGASRAFFEAESRVITATLCYDEVHLKENQVHWQGRIFDQLIFCEGYKASQNPWFGGLNYNHSKGNMIVVPAQAAPQSHILHVGKWILPIQDAQGKNWLKIGATYDTHFQDERPEPAQAAAILETLTPWIRQPLQAAEGLAGIRPIMLDNKPVLGRHPDYPQLGIFNGLASRGVSLGPYYAAQWASHLAQGAPFDPDVRVDRYFKSRSARVH